MGNQVQLCQSISKVMMRIRLWQNRVCLALFCYFSHFYEIDICLSYTLRYMLSGFLLHELVSGSWCLLPCTVLLDTNGLLVCTQQLNCKSQEMLDPYYQEMQFAFIDANESFYYVLSFCTGCNAPNAHLKASSSIDQVHHARPFLLTDKNKN